MMNSELTHENDFNNKFRLGKYNTPNIYGKKRKCNTVVTCSNETMKSYSYHPFYKEQCKRNSVDNTMSSFCNYTVKNFTQASNKDHMKAPSKPEDKIYNEAEDKENGKEICSRQQSISVLYPLEFNHNIVLQGKDPAEELRKKLAEDAVQAAPPSKPPETPEEIARELEIQRKIRESIVLVNPEQELALLKADPSEDIDMPSELRALLQTLTTHYLCQLCSVRIIGPQMAAMHYNGKNHLKKVRNFVQTNGRSAGFNMDSVAEPEESVKDNNKNTEVVDAKDIDEKKYCKLCKVSFWHGQHAQMHYKGKNHAKKLKNASSSNRTEIYECKICCVTVTSQEHLTAHLNGTKHKQQIRKMDNNEIYKGYLDCRGKGSNSLRAMMQGSLFGSGLTERNSVKPHGQGLMKNGINYSDEELQTLFGIEPSKKYKFDLANYRTPLGWLYCSYCDVSMLEDAQFLIHLGSRNHSEQLLKRTRCPKPSLNVCTSQSVLRSNKQRS